VREHPDRRAGFESLLAPVGLATVFDIADPDPKAAIIPIVSAQKHLTRDTIEKLVGDLAHEVGVPVEELAVTDGFIDWAQVQAMTRQGVTFGGHGVDHLLLTQVSDEQADDEVLGSRTELDARLKEPVPTFSYPNGYWTPRVAAKVRSVGYRLGFIAQGGPVTCDDDPWTLRRVNIHDSLTDTEPLFLARLIGLF
jgi:peptidoglycan/xylan/chitin deacetylase (PgdA/CDA1 family)